MPDHGPKTRHHIHLREGDYEFLTNAFRKKGLRPNTVIRALVARYIDDMKAKLESAPEIEEIKL